jgi:hypothetical protein
MAKDAMLPFDSYPGSGRQLPGPSKGASARHEYGLELMRQTGQRCCAYCGTDLTATYQIWLTLVVDHVVPVSVCKAAGILGEWYWDLSNTVLACGACNGFCNRYRPSFTVTPPETLAGFHDLRDMIFGERKRLIEKRHGEERHFFNRRPWDPTA